ncbi:MAG: T9SS C-terminal target domain-containing protein [Cytophagales bacterium]|nr:MAG: T9SS C-terminal target domain-containing protein [Cytophagales bacterium]
MEIKKVLALALIIFSSTNTFSQMVTPMRIVCIGNSITQGNGSSKFDGSFEISYRPWLWEKLISDGFNIDMVGYNNSYFGGSNYEFPNKLGQKFDNQSEGYYGINSNDLLKGSSSSGWTGSPLPSFSNRINDPSKGYTPDFALIHIGTNDADGDVAKTEANIKEIIKVLRAKNSSVVILLAKLITSWKPINKEIDRIVSELSDVNSKVVAVDLVTGFINDPGLSGTMTYDWVHPNKLGQISMMKGWYKALVANLNDNIKPTLSNKLVVSNVLQNSVNLSWDLGTDNYGVKSYEVYANNKLLLTTTNKPVFPLNIPNLTSGTKYDFAVLAKDFGGNNSDFITATANTSGINSTEAFARLEKIEVFPTYTSGKLTIKGAQGFKIELVNTLGNTIIRETRIENENFEIELKSPVDGLYYLKIKDNEVTKIVKVMVEK